MNHQPFENLLLSDQALSIEDEQRLRDHLESCSQCSELNAAWRSIEDCMSASPMAEPLSGFVNRFQANLEDELSKRKKRQNRFAIGFSTTAAIGFLAVWIINVSKSYSSPTQLFLGFAEEIKQYLSYINILKEVSVSITQVLPGVVPVSLWLITAATLALLVAAWFISIHRLMVQRRVLS
jgi:hypothetical protein